MFPSCIFSAKKEPGNPVPFPFLSFQDQSISKPYLSECPYSSLVIKIPSDSAPDTLCVHITNTLRLCSSVLEVA